MIIKNYIQFIKESSGHQYGCVMIEIPVNNWEEITKSIDPEDIYKESESDDSHGIQDFPHLTILYGLHKEVTPEMVKSVFENYKGEIHVEIDGIGIFENEKFDVVKFNVKPDGALQELHDQLSKFPNSDQFPIYKPHITIAYVKKGTGKKYAKPEYKHTVKDVSKIVYSMPDGNKIEFNYNSNESVNYLLKENKMWWKTIPEILQWIEAKSKWNWIWVDTETTGLKGPKEEQLTQVSAISSKYNPNSNDFELLGSFDEKIKLTQQIKSRYQKPDDTSRKILSFNRYGSGDYKWKDELEVTGDFFKWVEGFEPAMLVAQNAEFDMEMLAVRGANKIMNEVFDTKMLIKLYFLPLIQKLAETDQEYSEMVKSIGTSARDNGLISSSMSKVGPALGINMSGYHDALTDCKITMEMFKRIINLLKENQSVDITKYQAERIKTLRSK